MAMNIVCGLLAALLAAVAAMKLTHRPSVVASYARVGVPEHKLDLLAALLLAGATGLIVGLFVRPIGVAAALGVVAYFVGAIVAHVRAGDTRRLATPIVLELLAIAALALQITTP
jgi:hypothetical protein